MLKERRVVDHLPHSELLDPLLEWGPLTDPMCRENQGDARRTEEHVDREGVVCEGRLADREDRQTVPNRVQPPGPGTVLVRTTPHEDNRRYRREQVGHDREVECELNQLATLPNKEPNSKRHEPEDEAPLVGVRHLLPITPTPDREECDDAGVGKPKHRRPHVVLGTRALVGHEERQTNEPPKRPARDVGLDHPLVRAKRVRDGTQDHQGTREDTNLFRSQWTPSFLDFYEPATGTVYA